MTRDYTAEALLYAEAVTSGKWQRPIGKFEKLRCERFLASYKRQREDRRYQWKFSKEKANEACRFLEGLKHFRGTWAKQPFHMIAWQVLFVVEIYGWRARRNLALRRYNECYVEIARGNGKSFLAAALGIYELVEAGGRAAEVVSAATTGPQAAIVFNAAASIVRTGALEEMGHEAVPLAREIRYMPADDPEIHKFYYVNANSKSLDGLAQCLAIVDELHAHEKRALWDVLASGRGKVPNSWIFSITTAGYDQNGIAYQMKKTGEMILESKVEGRYADRAYFVMHCMDKGDDVFNMDHVEKSNPLFSFSPDLYEEVATEADACNPEMGGNDPQKRAEYETKRCNIWRTGWAAWLSKEQWEKCDFERFLLGDKNNNNVIATSRIFQIKESNSLWDWMMKHCPRLWIGMDLSSNLDFASTALIGMDPNPLTDWMYVAFKNYLPEEELKKRQLSIDIYKVFVDLNEIIPTPGDLIDQDMILEDIESVIETRKVRRVWFDHYSQADRVAARIAERHGKYIVATIKWSAAEMTPGAKEFEERVKSCRLIHEGAHVNEWMVCNAVVERRVNGTILPKKETEGSEKRIDCVHSSIIGISAWRDDPEGKIKREGGAFDIVLG